MLFKRKNNGCLKRLYSVKNSNGTKPEKELGSTRLNSIGNMAGKVNMH